MLFILTMITHLVDFKTIIKQNHKLSFAKEVSN